MKKSLEKEISLKNTCFSVYTQNVRFVSAAMMRSPIPFRQSEEKKLFHRKEKKKQQQQHERMKRRLDAL